MPSATCTWHYLPLQILRPFFDNYRNLAADLSGPVNETRTGTEISDKKRIITDRADRNGSTNRIFYNVRASVT